MTSWSATRRHWNQALQMDFEQDVSTACTLPRRYFNFTKMQFRRAIWRIFRAMLPHLTFHAKMRLADTILQDCGFGAGSEIRHSNEQVVFKSIEREIPVLFDIGAHCGEYTSLFLAQFQYGSAYCFEPIESHYKLLQQRMQ